ncbi:septal ring lytic transglycosylase RlpA family protein [Bradyrhizobium cenepequi]|uniref:septal ring lytic transglycosylase RlpA family protein n=1 Tax=Bradyrhizobium cenepequi TaxID=2821403 RepID=UPI0035DFF14C|nr:septal ring lytic transglycosylase RlpA family protein [Bradyrhizobium cenepequi]
MCFDRAVNSCVDVGGRAQVEAHLISAGPVGKATRLIAVVLGAASLAACAQSTVVSQRSEMGASRQASFVHTRTAAIAMKKRVAALRKHTRLTSRKGGDAKVAAQGVASFYSEDSQTASGEKFDKNELTAAHPNLPFGTKLRVTDVKSGRSVTVRVNDRGPYVQGRIVDVSYSAAQELGMVGKGLTNVRLDVLH